MAVCSEFVTLCVATAKVLSALLVFHPMPSDVGPNHCAGCANAKGYRLPVHRQFFDGRSDLDWLQSIRDYLRWRAGLAWRPIRHRGPCVADDYRDALHLLTQVFHGATGSDALRASGANRQQGAAPVSPSEVLPPQQRKKPVRSVPAYPTSQTDHWKRGLPAAAASIAVVTRRLGND